MHTSSGGKIDVDDSKGTGICPFCGKAFVTEKVIKQYVTNNNFTGANINVQCGHSLENLFTLARRTQDEGKIEDTNKYYTLILEQNPKSGEAYCYHSLYSIGFDEETRYEPENIAEIMTKSVSYALQQEDTTEHHTLQRIIYTGFYMASDSRKEPKTENVRVRPWALCPLFEMLEKADSRENVNWILNHLTPRFYQECHNLREDIKGKFAAACEKYNPEMYPKITEWFDRCDAEEAEYNRQIREKYHKEAVAKRIKIITAIVAGVFLLYKCSTFVEGLF